MTQDKYLRTHNLSEGATSTLDAQYRTSRQQSESLLKHTETTYFIVRYLSRFLQMIYYAVHVTCCTYVVLSSCTPLEIFSDMFAYNIDVISIMCMRLSHVTWSRDVVT